MHVHISKDNSTAKIWLEPSTEIAENKGFSEKELSSIIKIITKHEEEFKAKFRAYIG
jgi:RNAse (barnase) inhibitor barstar